MTSRAQVVPEECGAFLEALGLSVEPPHPRFFEELYLRFNKRFPFETLTARERGRPPETVLRDFVEEGKGSTGVERIRTLLRLGRALGFVLRPIQGKAVPGKSVSRSGRIDRPQHALIAELEGRSFLAHTAGALSVLVPLEPARIEIPAASGTVSLRRESSSLSLLLAARGRTRERERFDLSEFPDQILVEESEGDDGTEGGYALRLLDDRVLHYRKGRIDVLDSWSRLSFSLPEERREILEQLFLVAGEHLAPETPERVDWGPATLTVYDRSELGIAELQARISNPQGLLRIQPAGLRAEELSAYESGWSWSLVDEQGSLVRRERVELLEDGISTRTLEGESPVATRRYSFEKTEGLDSQDLLAPRETGTRVVLATTLSREVPPRGLAESVRKTLVFHLVAELLALSHETPER